MANHRNNYATTGRGAVGPASYNGFGSAGQNDSVLVEDSQPNEDGSFVESQQQDSEPFGAHLSNYPSSYPASQAGGFGNDYPAGQYSQQSFIATQEYTQQTQPSTQPVASAPQASPPQRWACLLPNTKNPNCPRIEIEGSAPETMHTIGRSIRHRLPDQGDSNNPDAEPQYIYTDTVIENLRISGTHCKIWREFEPDYPESELNALVKIQDYSTNGTYVRGIKLGKGKITILNHGDDICLGPAYGKGFPLHDEFRYAFHIEPHLRPRGRDDPSLAGGLFLRYDVFEQLGKGSFAVVHRAVDKETGTSVAIKIINKTRFAKDKKSNQMLKREVMIMKNVEHHYIVKYIDGFEDPDYLWLVLEYVDGGDLLDFITSKKGLSEDEASEIAIMICEALAYLHQNSIVHRDLKPENILVTKHAHPICKIADFGLAKLSQYSMLQTMCGTPAYLAPEVILQDPRARGYSAAVDSWSLGVIIYACLTNASPFPNEDSGIPLHQRMQVREPDMDLLYNSTVSDAAIDFIEGLLDRNPATRLTPYDALKHPWLEQNVNKRLSSGRLSMLQPAPLPPHRAAAYSASTSYATTPVRTTHGQNATRAVESVAPRSNTSAATSHISLAPSEQSNAASASTRPTSHEGDNDQDEDDDDDAASYSQKLGRMNLHSDAGLEVGDSGLLEDEGFSPVGAMHVQTTREQVDSSMSFASGTAGEASQDGVTPQGSAATAGMKRKQPPSAFSSDSSILSQGQGLPSMASSGISALGARFSPELPRNHLANAPPVAIEPPRAAHLRTVSNGRKVQQLAASTSTSTKPAPLRAPSPTSSLSSLSSDSESKQADTDAHESEDHVQPKRPSRTAAKGKGRQAQAQAQAGPSPKKKNPAPNRRRSTRYNAKHAPSYVESESEDDEDISSSLSRSKNRSGGRARKQRRISQQPT